MCIVCILYQQEKLTKFEARNGLQELVVTNGVDFNHAQSVLDLLTDPLDQTEVDAIDRMLYESGQ